MAGRGMSAAMLTEIAKSGNHPFHLVKIALDTPIYATDGERAVLFGGNTYNPDGAFLSFGDLAETVQLRADRLQLAFSGAQIANLATLLNQDLIDKEVTIYRGFFDTAGAVITDPIEIWFGYTDGGQFSEAPGGSAAMSIEASNHWVRFDRITNRRTNNSDQNFYFPGDDCFEFAAEMVRDLRWGRA